MATYKELRGAVKAAPAEIVVADPALARKVVLWNALRTIANVAVIVILALAILAWADPLNLPLLKQPWAGTARRLGLGVGVLLLFAEYVLPVVRLYKPAGSDTTGLKLIPRKSK